MLLGKMRIKNINNTKKNGFNNLIILGIIFTILMSTGVLAQSPGVMFTSPIEGATLNTVDVIVTFETTNHIVGPKGKDHIHFYLDESVDQLMFYNSPDKIVELNTRVGSTSIATWISPNQIRFNELPNGEHDVLAILTSALHFEYNNPEAKAIVSFIVDVQGNVNKNPTCPSGSEFFINPFGTPCASGSCWTNTCRTDFADGVNFNIPNWYVQCPAGDTQLTSVGVCGTTTPPPTTPPPTTPPPTTPPPTTPPPTTPPPTTPPPTTPPPTTPPPTTPPPTSPPTATPICPSGSILYSNTYSTSCTRGSCWTRTCRTDFADGAGYGFSRWWVQCPTDENQLAGVNSCVSISTPPPSPTPPPTTTTTCPSGTTRYSKLYGTSCVSGTCWTRSCRTDFVDGVNYNWRNWWVQCPSGESQLTPLSICGVTPPPTTPPPTATPPPPTTTPTCPSGTTRYSKLYGTSCVSGTCWTRSCRTDFVQGSPYSYSKWWVQCPSGESQLTPLSTCGITPPLTTPPPTTPPPSPTPPPPTPPPSTTPTCPSGSTLYTKLYSTSCVSGTCWTKTCRTDFADGSLYGYSNWWIQCPTGEAQITGVGSCTQFKPINCPFGSSYDSNIYGTSCESGTCLIKLCRNDFADGANYGVEGWYIQCPTRDAQLTGGVGGGGVGLGGGVVGGGVVSGGVIPHVLKGVS